MSIPLTSCLIGGEFRASSANASYDIRNPYSKDLVGRAVAASSEDCQDAIRTASQASSAWEKSPLSVRRNIFLQAAELLSTSKYRDRIKTALQDEIASTDIMVDLDISGTIENLRTAAGLVNELKGESFSSYAPGGQVITQKRAIGVIYAVASWNMPIGLAARAIAIPIVCGNTVVFRVSETSPRAQNIVAELLHEAGLPAGVLNTISVSKEDVPARTAEIIAHPAIRKINFTGSDHVARKLAVEAGKHLKPCVFELGGKAPVVVLADADIECAAYAITSSALLNSGQICMSTERVIVQRSVAPALISALTALFSQVKAGGPGEPLSTLFSEESAENIVQMIREARDGGAEILVGDVARDGAVVQPHLLSNVNPSMKLWGREIAVVTEVDTIDEAVSMANASEYTLMAGLWTRDVHTAFDVASRIRCGTVNVNGQTLHNDGYMGGLGGASGYGRFNVDNFTDTRVITFHPHNSRSHPLSG